MKYKPIIEKNKTDSGNLETPEETRHEDYKLTKNYVLYEQLTSTKNKGYTSPKSMHPRPDSDDYESGFFIRYFVVKINEPIAMEIDQEQFKSLETVANGLDDKMYTGYKLRWKIKGPKYDVIKNNRIVETSVENTNAKTVANYPKSIQKLIGFDFLRYAITE